MASRRRDHVPAVALLLTASLLALAACSASPEQEPAIEVAPQDGAFDPLAITLTGLGAGREVRLVATTELEGSAMSSRATFVADEDGRVDLATTAPTEGSWTTADAMGPFWSMNRASLAALSADVDVRLVVSADDDVLAEAVVERRGYGADVDVQDVTDDGMVAAYAVPDGLSADASLPAVLVFSGSEGGLGNARATAISLAALGYPALAISYFKSPGQPPQLENVPVETFLTGLAWLREQPGVDTERVFTFGQSRGGEMALWLAANHPDEVYGAFAPTGAGRLYCGYPNHGVPAWTLAGEGLPCAEYRWGVPPPPEAVVDVDAIVGPTVLACGRADPVWEACLLLTEATSRFSDPTQVRAIVQEDAGHFIVPAPYQPIALDEPGAEPAATHQARVDLWNAVADVLAQARQ
ncbi:MULTISPECIES: acyl-CoA thioesterase/BAAT N-terminal domain-containing protein [Oerskovia]|uniref:Acyl-CoA thioesterase/BAAT N-terminal domain-containing protein n=2 Tax=Oerskovia TaxID=162491 RepID=A0ABR8UYP7_9CELL|nr:MULTISPECIES: acyl-CoA thioesterase/BAAT N-terminal domain-containing protein [Oerskovia]MBD7997186.1 acyl-CoA thioesterase/BAAT N-terminal domain-containing protein [Oerskovia gallyi]MBM7497934.1 dienelactone hydrolase [Oerskovia paurometabola]